MNDDDLLPDRLTDRLNDLADAARGAATRGPLSGIAPATVHRVATRVRRRRAARHAGAGVAAVGAAGVVLAGSQASGLWHAAGTAEPGGGNGFVPGPAPSWTATAGPGATPLPDGTAAPETEGPHGTADSAVPTGASTPEALTPAQRAGKYGPAAAVFWCGEPVHTTIHTRPDAHGLLLAADDDLTAQVAGVAQLTWHASLPDAARYAILGSDGTVVAQLVEDDDTLTRVDGTSPEQTHRLTGAVHVVGCEGAPAPQAGATVTAWPYISADVYSSATDTTPTPVVVIAEPREITVP